MPTTDLFHLDAVLPGRLEVFSVVDIDTGRVYVTGVTANPVGEWAIQRPAVPASSWPSGSSAPCTANASTECSPSTVARVSGVSPSALSHCSAPVQKETATGPVATMGRVRDGPAERSMSPRATRRWEASS